VISGSVPAKMTLVELQEEMMGCHPGSPQWDEIWSAHEMMRAESETRRVWTSTAIGLTGLVVAVIAGEAFVAWWFQ
jgi:hypothetical protein